jgi:hypothetical protein
VVKEEHQEVDIRVHLGVNYPKVFQQEKNPNSRIHKFLFAEMAEELNNILHRILL